LIRSVERDGAELQGREDLVLFDIKTDGLAWSFS